MEIRVYNAELKLLGIIENQTSLIWIRKFYEPGTFELHAPVTEYNLKLLQAGNIIAKKKGGLEGGVIEDLNIEESNTENEITAKGRFLSSYMDRRLIKSTFSFSGKAEVAMRNILSNAASIPLVELGNLNDFEETVSFQATYKNLLTYMTKLSKNSNIGFWFRPDFTNKKIYFETYKGKDRSRSQGINNKVEFSESYANLNEAIYKYNDQTYKTVAYVGGSGEGSDRKYVTVGSGEGLELREVFVDAKDIQEDELTEEEYEAALIQRGQDALNEDIISTSFECKTGADINFTYMVNYDLGDIVTVRKKNWGISEDLRITEIQETYEYGAMVIEPVLGDPLPETVDWSD